MSRRKQAMPRAFKREDVADHELMVLASDLDGSVPAEGFPEMLLTESATSWVGGEGSVSMTPPGSASPVETAAGSIRSPSPIQDTASTSAPYTCTFCNKNFPRLSLLKKHEQTHSEDMPYQCDFCQRLFKHKRSRDRHVKLHTGDKKYRCEHCEAAFSRSDHLKIHIKTHDTRKPFQCSVCQRGYNTGAALTSHMLNHRRDSGSGSVSSISSSASLSSTSSNSPTPSPSVTSSSVAPSSVSPVISERDLEPPSTEARQSMTCPVVSPVAPVLVTCPQCKEQHPPDALQEHLQVHKRSTSTVPLDHPAEKSCDPSKDKTEEVRSTEVVITGPVLTCPYCPNKESFDDVEALAEHVQSSHGPLTQSVNPTLNSDTPFSIPDRLAAESTFSCQLCFLSFSSVPALQQHTLSSHSLSQVLRLYYPSPFNALFHTPHPAPTLTAHDNQSRPTDLSCKKADTANLNVHPLSLSNHPAYLCNQCHAALPDFESFRAHLQTHLSQSPYASLGHYVTTPTALTCPECGVDFPYNDPEQFENHLVNHLSSASSEYSCHACLKMFSKPDELQKHLMDIHAHHLYRCALCKEMFDSKVAIQIHFAVKHSNETKVFNCTGCGMLSRSEAEFHAHVKHAHWPRPSIAPIPPLATLRCPLCPEAFAVEFLLDRHVALAHPHWGGLRLPPDVSTNPKKPNSAPPVRNDALKCEACGEVFLTAAHLHQHRLSAHPHTAHNVDTDSEISDAPAVLNLSLQCAYCKETCKSRAELELHTKSHNQGANAGHVRVKCNICDEVFSTAAILAEHKLTHCKVLGVPQCTLCKVPLRSEKEFYAHAHQHAADSNASNSSAESNPLPISCVVCRQTLALDLELELHAKFHLNQNSEPVFPCCICAQQFESQNLIANGLVPGIPGLQTYVCKECFHRDHPLGFPPSTPSIASAFIVRHPQVPTAIHTRTYQCIKCQQSFASEAEIQMHVATHWLTEGSQHDCRLCLRSFETPLKLQVHLIEHTFAGCSSFACYICGCTFTSAVGLQKHMLEHGLTARPYDCSYCHLKFFFRAELENHLFSHQSDHILSQAFVPAFSQETLQSERECPVTDEPKDKTEEICVEEDQPIVDVESNEESEEKLVEVSEKLRDKCDNKQERDQELEPVREVSPLLQVSSEVESKVFRCDRCEKSFPCLSNLQGHIRIHTQSTKFNCPTCSKEFALSRNLHIHMRSHSGEKPYECHICKKRFARKENRKAHLKSHSGLRPFPCHICQKAFSRKCHLREHIRTHGKESKLSLSSSSEEISSSTCSSPGGEKP